MKELLSTTLGRLRAVAFMEGISLLLLLMVTMPLKYLVQVELPNEIVGMLHGFLFIGYVILVIIAKFEYKWSWWSMLLALAASVVPFGTFVADDMIFQKTTV